MAYRFQEKLIDLLPAIYRQEDKAGDLRTFLQIPAATLDEIEGLIDRLPGIIDVDWCEERFLPFLGAIVGYQYDPLESSVFQRRRIREAIETYRRKGTTPAIYHELVDQGFKGIIEETYRKAIRLNKRSKLCKAKLPGEVYSLGVFRIISHNLNPNLEPSSVFHHPAGTRRYIWQWQSSVLPILEHESFASQIVHYTCLVNLDETNSLNRNALNSNFRLSPKSKSWVLWSTT